MPSPAAEFVNLDARPSAPAQTTEAEGRHREPS